MIRRPTRFTRTVPLFPYTTLFRSIRLFGLPSHATVNSVASSTGFNVELSSMIITPYVFLSAAKPNNPNRRRPLLNRHRQSPQTFFCRSEEHTSELQSLMRTSYAVFCLKKKKTSHINYQSYLN